MFQLNSILRFFLSLILIGLITGSVNAQIGWESPLLQIKDHDGLPSTYYKDFVEDEFGFIWLSTYGGVCRFDGIKLKCLEHEDLPEHGFSKIKYDKEQNTLWISAATGLFSYDLVTEQLKKYQLLSGFSGGQILSMELDHKGRVWVGSRNKLVKLEPGTDTLINVELDIDFPHFLNEAFSEINDIKVDPVNPDKLWLATEGGVIEYWIEENRFNLATEKIGNEGNFEISEIFVSPNTKKIYFGVTKQRSRKKKYNYFVFDPVNETAGTKLLFNTNWDTRKTTCLNDSIIIFSMSSGIIQYDEKNDRVVKRLQNDGINKSFYRVDFIDSGKNIWSGTPEGINMYRSSSTNGRMFYYESEFPDWFHIVANHIYEDTVNSLIYMPVFGGEGLYVFDQMKGEWNSYPIANYKEGEILKTDFSAVFNHKDKIHLLGNSGFYDFDENAGEIIRSKVINIEALRNCSRGLLASNGMLWTNSSEGITKIDLSTKQFEVFKDKLHFCHELSGRSIFYEDRQNNIFIGGLCGGFDMYSSSEDQFYAFDIDSTFSYKIISAFKEHQGLVWAITDNGHVFQIDPTDPSAGIQNRINISEEIQSGKLQLINIEEGFEKFDEVASAAFDREGRFWILTGKGLFRYDYQANELELFKEDVGIEIIDPGMKVFACGNLTRLHNGKMMFTTRKGICIFDPNQLSNEKEVPMPYITSIRVNNQEIKSDSGSYFKLNYELKANENFIGIDFSALAFSNPLNVKYNYKLEGVDEIWKNPGEKRFITYTKLKGGKYKFQLRAADVSGLWNQQTVQVELNIAKYWYNTSWARGLFFSIIIFGLFYTYFNRLKIAIEKEQVKTAYEKDLAELKMQALTAQMNPHFIFNSLNSIDYYIIKNDTRKASKYLNRFSRLMRLILKNSRSNYISLRDDLEALKLYLEIEALRFDHKFKYQIKVDDQIDSDYVRIPPMLIQPYVENSIWHGLLHKQDNGMISVKFDMDQNGDAIKCTIEDNGIGREKSQALKNGKATKNERKSFGMNITKDKIEVINYLHDLNANVEIIDLYNQNNESTGTRVELNIPI